MIPLASWLLPLPDRTRHRNQLLASHRLGPGLAREGRGDGAGPAQGHWDCSAAIATAASLTHTARTTRQFGFSEDGARTVSENQSLVCRIGLAGTPESTNFGQFALLTSQADAGFGSRAISGTELWVSGLFAPVNAPRDSYSWRHARSSQSQILSAGATLSTQRKGRHSTIQALQSKPILWLLVATGCRASLPHPVAVR